MLSFTDFFNADKTYKSREDIQRMLDYLGIRREQQVYTH
jgi:3-mercaptopyruvate sulfurtransferase SseA